MNPGIHLSDRMPVVAAGEARWLPGEADHLAECEECRAEWTLVEAAAKLGRNLEVSLDVPAIEAGVLAGLRSPASRSRRVPPAWWLLPLGIAALLAIAVLRQPSSAPETEPAVSLLPELENLSSTELESVLTLFPAAGMSPGQDGFEDLSESEVSSVLKDLEG